MAIPEVFQKVCDKNGWSLGGNTVEITLDGGRRQRVFVETFRHEDDEMARAFTVVGSSEDLSQTRAQSALGLNFGLSHGALAIHEGNLVMTDTFLIKDADEDEVEASVRFLSKTADRYEKLIYGTDHN